MQVQEHVLGTLHKKYFHAKASKCTFRSSELENLATWWTVPNQGEPKNGFCFDGLASAFAKCRWSGRQGMRCLVAILFDQF